MWIDFSCHNTRDYMIKIYVGGVNAISGEHALGDAGTKLRRKAKLARQYDSKATASPLQDYVVVPGQPWLDRIADSDGTVRQFVAMPFGSGHSVESQITGSDAVGGIQFEITPCKPRPVVVPHTPRYSKAYNDPGGKVKIFVKTLTGKNVTVYPHLHDSIDVVKELIRTRRASLPTCND